MCGNWQTVVRFIGSGIRNGLLIPRHDGSSTGQINIYLFFWFLTNLFIWPVTLLILRYMRPSSPPYGIFMTQTYRCFPRKSSTIS